MKFKTKYEKANVILMTSIILVLIFTCVVWLILREYIYFVIYLILTLLIAYTYFFTSYYINENYLLCKLGVIKIKINYKKIKNIEDLKNKVKINLEQFNFSVYPLNKDMFITKLNSKLTNKNSYNIINKK